MANPLAGSWAKANRGQEQLTALYTAVTESLKAPPLEFALEFEEQAPAADGQPIVRVYVVVKSVPTLQRDPHGLMLGETLQSFRAALDHAAWVIWRRRGDTSISARRRRRVMFPMARTAANYRSGCNRWLPGVPEDPYLTLIERYQPYKRNMFGRTIRVLRKFSDIDKHRLIIPTTIVPLHAYVEIHTPVIVPIASTNLLRDGQPIRVGTKVAMGSFVGGVIGKRKVTVNPHMTCLPGLPGRLNLEPTMDSIAACCLHILSELEKAL